MRFDHILVAAGRSIEIDALGLEKTSVRLNEDGLIIIDETCKTLDESIYAIGDVTPGQLWRIKLSGRAKSQPSA